MSSGGLLEVAIKLTTSKQVASALILIMDRNQLLSFFRQSIGLSIVDVFQISPNYDLMLVLLFCQEPSKSRPELEPWHSEKLRDATPINHEDKS